MSSTVPEDKANFAGGLRPHPITEEVPNGNSSAISNSQIQEHPPPRIYPWQLNIIDKKVKRNGFALPLHSYQITSWFIFALDTYAFYFINMVTFSY